MVVSPTLLSYALAREVISTQRSKGPAEIFNNLKCDKSYAFFLFHHLLQTTSSVVTLDTCTQPGGKENTLETTLLIRDVRESTAVSL